MTEKKHNTSKSLNQLDTKVALAKLRNCPTSPRKMRLVVDQIRGLDVNKALVCLLYTSDAADE